LFRGGSDEKAQPALVAAVTGLESQASSSAVKKQEQHALMDTAKPKKMDQPPSQFESDSQVLDNNKDDRDGGAVGTKKESNARHKKACATELEEEADEEALKPAKMVAPVSCPTVCSSPASSKEGDHGADTEVSMATNTPQSAHKSEASLVSTPVETEKASIAAKKPPPSPSDAAARPAPAIATQSSEAKMTMLFDKSDFEDPITYQIMADPVSCSDGHTYDREVIEKCFQDRIQAEQERQERERRRQEGGEEESSNTQADATCCRGREDPIELLSPISNQVVSGVLVPNLMVEKQICRMMEQNVFQLLPQELDDWKKRRETKRQRDTERREQGRLDKERSEEQRRNAQAAMERRELEGDVEDEDEMPKFEPSHLFRLVSDHTKSQNEPEIGMAVVLTQEGCQIPIDLAAGAGAHPESEQMRASRFLQKLNFGVAGSEDEEEVKDRGSQLRCMVGRCAKRLNSTSVKSPFDPLTVDWSSRCGRIVCQECLAFSVKDYQQHQHTSTTSSFSKDHKICVDCMTHLVDVMEEATSEGTSLFKTQLRKKRLAFLQQLEQHGARFSNRVALLHERVVRYQANLEHSPKLIKMEHSISQLGQQLDRLNAEASQETKRATAAAADRTEREVDSNDSCDSKAVEETIQQMMTECQRLEGKLQQHSEQGPPDENDEERLLQYFTRLSELEHSLETGRTELAVVMSKQELRHKNDWCRNSEVSCLEADVQKLEERYESLMTGDVAENGVSAVDRILLVSKIEAELEEKQILLATAHSMQHSSKFSLGREPKQQTATSSSLFGNFTSFKLDCTTNFIRAAREKAPSQSKSQRRTHTSSGRKSIFRMVKPNKSESLPFISVNEWIRSIEQLKDELLSVPSMLQRLCRAKTLLAMLDSTSMYFTCDDNDSFSISVELLAAQTELAELALNLEIGEKRKASGGNEIFSDAQTHLLDNESSQPAVPPPFYKAKDESDTNTVVFPDALAPSFNNSPTNIENIVCDISAIGVPFNDWPLPLNLIYPTPRMVRQLEVMKNALELRRVESESAVQDEWNERFQTLEKTQAEIEGGLIQARLHLKDAKENAKEEERQRKAREERRIREQERLEQERILRKKREKAEREKRELQRRHRQEEVATRDAFRRVAGADNNGAETFGGAGDFRMCRRCRTGPIENQACSDLEAHNDTGTSYKGNNVGEKANPNHCPHCGWFHKDWKKWPYWDGVYGPH